MACVRRSRIGGTAFLVVVLAACGTSARKTEAPRLAETTTTTVAPMTTTTRPRATTTTVAPTTVPHAAPPTTRFVTTRNYTPPAPAPAPVPRAPVAAPTCSGGSEGGAAGQIVAGINAYRASHGLCPLGVNGNLVSKAQSWAQNMAAGGCGLGAGGVPNICHSSLTSGITVSWTLLEENVGMISPSTNVSGMESAFEHSPPHSENMLNGQIDDVGVGVAYVNVGGSSYMYVAEEFMAT